ncbi:ImmA/IrrE family metallo-endopeptidase [Chlorobaculum sp. 24CR]|uniref:ImmA/IrrE family metallo-endopeptidase n=1 Tax=Chlorobaculum sp. 24CR TaxID=2508878 RepID=UPI00100B0801|nr:ImmA/IrrE family metallo-endopeptidase [Chlorobaculum sp. 24CR]RXK87790.1 ImmA/IrrE family metallo-endopeptidase [Chlorobaculum sp. 24CR]
MSTVSASIPVLQWAASRAWLSDTELEKRFRKWPLWLKGEASPTLKQLEDFARLTHTPFGYFFLPDPPELTLPVPDFRTHRDNHLREPSTALLDTIYLCQQRQEWFREYALIQGLQPLRFVGSATISDDPDAVAAQMRQELSLSVAECQALPTWTDALRQLIAKAEEAGVLVMATSIVGSNSHRKLDAQEFRGFAFTDNVAPLIFLNAADSKAAQMFTLAHELAHIWLAESGLSNPEAGVIPELQIERWCNHVAAELLVPKKELHNAHDPGIPVEKEMHRLARFFKVSTLVVLRRLFEAGFIDRATMNQCYQEELDRILSLEKRKSPGGDFYRTLGARTGKRFARAILFSTLEGHTLFRDAFRLLGVRKSATFYEAAHELGVMP